jgi:PAS domain S-box-containing protein
MIDALRAEIAERQEAERRLDLALWATDLTMWEWGPRTERARTDTRWAEVLGYGPDEVSDPAALWESITHPDDRLAVRRAWNAHARDGTAQHYEVEVRLRAKSGGYRWFLTRGKVVERGTGGEVLRMTGTNRDITALKLIEEQARQHQAELAHILRLQTVNCLAAELAHEINQPLGAIANFANGLAERLRQGRIDRDEILGAAETIAGQALRAGTVLQRLRDFVRKEPQPRSVDVNQLVELAAEFVAPEARRRAVVLDLRLEPGLPPVLADGVQVEQVIVNLLHNGIEAIAGAGAAQGRLLATTRRGAGGMVDVCVHDSGPGVSAAARERLFEPFFTTKDGGLGMGLSISRSIVNAYGGSLWLAPSDAGGATFCFSLPAADAPD